MATYTSRDDDTVVASFPKNIFEEVKVVVGPYKGQTLVDARVWRNGSAHSFRTKKGLSLRPEQVPQLIRGLLAALEHVNGDETEASDH
jgi:hypothetical protein